MYTFKNEILIACKICDAGIFYSEDIMKKYLWLVQLDGTAEPSVITINSSLAEISLFQENIFPFAKSGCSNSEIQKPLFLPLCLSSNYIIGSLQWGSGGGEYFPMVTYSWCRTKMTFASPHGSTAKNKAKKEITFPRWDGSGSIDPNTKGSSKANGRLSNIVGHSVCVCLRAKV